MWDQVGAAILIYCLAVWWAFAWLGGKLAAKREQPGWTPTNHEPPVDHRHIIWINGHPYIVTDQHPSPVEEAETILRDAQ